jgi:hypothetical protein
MAKGKISAIARPPACLLEEEKQGSLTASKLKKSLLQERAWCKDFISRLSETANVTAACRQADIGLRTAYDWRGKNADFAEAWDDAIDECIDTVELDLLDRVLGRKPSNAAQNIAIFFWLKAMRPEKYRDFYDANKLATALAAQLNGAIGARAPLTPPAQPAAIDVEHKQIECVDAS